MTALTVDVTIGDDDLEAYVEADSWTYEDFTVFLYNGNGEPFTDLQADDEAYILSRLEQQMDEIREGAGW